MAFHWAAGSIYDEAILPTHLVDHYGVLEARLGTQRSGDWIAVVSVQVHISTSVGYHALLETGPSISLRL